MQEVLELDAEIAGKILCDAETKGLPVEIYLKQFVCSEKKDERIHKMCEALRDELFLADLAETMKDFRPIDIQ